MGAKLSAQPWTCWEEEETDGDGTSEESSSTEGLGEATGPGRPALHCSPAQPEPAAPRRLQPCALRPPSPAMAGAVRYAQRLIAVAAEEECRKASNRQSVFKYRGFEGEMLEDPQNGLLVAHYRVRARGPDKEIQQRVYQATYDVALGKVVELGDAVVLLGGTAATW
mmetsp:Transcript_90795/g.282399  ORF Transcript_90795/g.282399 Transcript_90795/m.282399 type:complete len:167 (+) Transcript_90795:114-614(+)